VAIPAWLYVPPGKIIINSAHGCGMIDKLEKDMQRKQTVTTHSHQLHLFALKFVESDVKKYRKERCMWPRFTSVVSNGM
jgi:hypothetical protein